MHQATVVSVFTGAGGLDLGVAAAGAPSDACVDSDEDCVQTLKCNVQFADAAVLHRDLRSLAGEELLHEVGVRQGGVALLIGGPPCQSFSKAAYWTSTGEEARRREASRPATVAATNLARSTHTGKTRDPSSDPRTNLVAEYARLLSELAPAGFIFENVVSITHPTSRLFFEKFLHECRSLGYSTTWTKVNAAEYGVPQLRKRVFVLGLRGNVTPRPPKPTHALTGQRDDTGGLLPPVTSNEWIGKFAGADFAEPEEVVVGKWASHLSEIPPGCNYKALTAWAGHPDPTFEAETRFWHFLLKLHPDLPSWTIAANPGPWTGPFHWESRRLRIPELAALQGFPDGYQFVGKRRSIRAQIGNAVPPLFGQRMAESVLLPILGRETPLSFLKEA